MNRPSSRTAVRASAALLLTALLGASGCSSSRSSIFTFSQNQAGNVCAADSLGAGLVSSNAKPDQFATAHATVATAIGE